VYNWLVFRLKGSVGMGYPREDQIIIEATREWLQNSNYTQAMFATQMLAPKIEQQEPESAEGWEKWHSKLCQRVSVIMTYKQPFPLTWKWAWINALPPEVRAPLDSELAAVSGYLHTLPVIKGVNAVTANTAMIYNGFSSLVKNSTPAHDGVYDENDELDAANAQIDASLNLIGVLIEEIQRIHAGTGATGKIRDLEEIDKMLGGLCTQSSNEK